MLARQGGHAGKGFPRDCKELCVGNPPFSTVLHAAGYGGQLMLDENLVRTRDVPLIMGYGGGVNSLAVLIEMVRRGLRPDLVTFADTGGEKPETYEHIRLHAEPWMRRHGIELVRVYNQSPRAGYTSLEDDCLKKETLPSRAFGMSSCAMRWKVEPQDKALTSWPPARQAWTAKKKPIKVLGYDGGETRRAEVVEDGRLRYWYPLIEWDIDRDGCEAIIRNEGLALPPKSACFYCPSSTKSEVIQLSRRHPALFARAVAIEDRALASTKHGGLRNIRGLGRHWSWRELVAATESEQQNMPESPVEACLICDDGGCPTEVE